MYKVQYSHPKRLLQFTKVETGRMVQLLKTCAALVETQVQFPTPIWTDLKLSITPVPGDPVPLPCANTCIYVYLPTHTT